jgi:hypothetical protein
VCVCGGGRRLCACLTERDRVCVFERDCVLCVVERERERKRVKEASLYIS